MAIAMAMAMAIKQWLRSRERCWAGAAVIRVCGVDGVDSRSSDRADFGSRDGHLWLSVSKQPPACPPACPPVCPPGERRCSKSPSLHEHSFLAVTVITASSPQTCLLLLLLLLSPHLHHHHSSQPSRPADSSIPQVSPSHSPALATPPSPPAARSSSAAPPPPPVGAGARFCSRGV